MRHLSLGRYNGASFLIALASGLSSIPANANLTDAVPLVYNVRADGVDVTCRYINVSNQGIAPRNRIVADLEAGNSINYHIGISHGETQNAEGHGEIGAGSITPFLNPSVRAALCPPATMTDGVLVPEETTSGAIQAAVNRALVAGGNPLAGNELHVTNLGTVATPLSAEAVKFDSAGCPVGAEGAFLPAGVRTNSDLHNQFCSGVGLRALKNGLKVCLSAFENSISSAGSAGNGLPTPEEFSNRYTAWRRTEAGQSNMPGSENLQYCNLLGSVFDGSHRNSTLLLDEMFPMPSCNGDTYVNTFSDQFPNMARVHQANSTNEGYLRLLERTFGTINTERSRETGLTRTLQRHLNRIAETASTLPCRPHAGSEPEAPAANAAPAAGLGSPPVAAPAAPTTPVAVQGNRGDARNVGGSSRSCEYRWNITIPAAPAPAFCTRVRRWRSAYYPVCKPWAEERRATVEFVPPFSRAPLNIIRARQAACHCANPTGRQPWHSPEEYGGQLADGEDCGIYMNPRIPARRTPFYGYQAPAPAAAVEPAPAPTAHPAAPAPHTPATAE